jgi:hypothetical protein
MLRSTAAEAVQMVDDLLSFSRVNRAELRRVPVDFNAGARVRSRGACCTSKAGVRWSG